jgi:calcineurin-like phosphoesterase family protein
VVQAEGKDAVSTYLYADPHFFHEGILKHCRDTRPFANAREMNQALADAWHSTVRHGDDVIVVGDFAHRADPAALRKLFDSLPGTKHLIVGNHDTLALPWASIRDIAYMSIDGTRVVLCHYPMLSWPGSRKGSLMLYGHHHGKIPGNQQSADIGVDVMGLAPIRLNTIKAYMSTLPPRVDPEAGDNFENDAGVKP